MLERVGRLHVSTHGDAVHHAVMGLLCRAGWHCVYALHGGRSYSGRGGPFTMGDGHQAWVRRAGPAGPDRHSECEGFWGDWPVGPPVTSDAEL